MSSKSNFPENTLKTTLPERICCRIQPNMVNFTHLWSQQQCIANSSVRQVELRSHARLDSDSRQLPAVDRTCEPKRRLAFDCVRHQTSLILELYSKAILQRDGVEYRSPATNVMSALSPKNQEIIHVLIRCTHPRRRRT